MIIEKLSWKEAIEAMNSWIANSFALPVLGTVDTFSVTFDGIGSMFPINIISDKDGLLWSIDCNIDDPLYDKFRE